MGINLLNLNKKIEDKKQKEYEKDVKELVKEIDELLMKKGYRIQAILNITPIKIDAIITFIKLSSQEIEAVELKKKIHEKENPKPNN